MSEYIKVIENVINYIEDNLCESIKVLELAKGHGMSPWQFQRIFRSHVGDSLGNYIRSRRLTKVAEALINSDQKIIDIAIEYQFNSQEALTRSFKSFFGMTPKKLRTDNCTLNLINKPKITPELLKYLCGGIELEPKIITRPAMKLVGRELILGNVFSEYIDCDEILVPFWQSFNEVSDDIENRKTGYALGLAKCWEEFDIEEGIHYMAAVEVSEFGKTPEGMVKYEVPERKYAVFTCKGTGDTTCYTLNYIYGTWLPQSSYKRASGDDFVIFDHRFEILNADSIYDHYLPIEDL